MGQSEIPDRGVCPTEVFSATIRTADEGDHRMQSWIHVIEWRATAHPGVTALVDDRGARHSYAGLLQLAERRAGGWAGLGAGPGDVVAVVARNSADFLVHAFALMRAGATPAFINWRLSVPELTDVLSLFQPAAVAADADFAAAVAAAAPELATRVVIGGGGADGWLDGAALDGPAPPRPDLSSGTVMALVH